MNDDNGDVPPPYSGPSNDLSRPGDQRSTNRTRSISAQVSQSLSSIFLQRDRRKSAQPTFATSPQIPSLYPSLDDALFTLHEEQTQSDIAPIEVHLKEIWEAGYGVHTGLFKKLSKIADTGGETSWRIVKLEWFRDQLLFHENSKTNPISLKHSVFGVDRNYKAHPYTLTIQQVNGKIMKLGFPDSNSFNSWQLFLNNKQKAFK
jgi:hypothetical protein